MVVVTSAYPILQINVQAPENHTEPIFLFNLRDVTTTDGDINYESIYNSTNPIFHYFLVTPPNNNLVEVDMTTGNVTLDPMNSLVSARKARCGLCVCGGGEWTECAVSWAPDCEQS